MLLTSVENMSTIKCMTHRPQLELDLRLPIRWGGVKEGAGRKAAMRPKVWHRSRVEFPERNPGLVTIRVRSAVPSLRTLSLIRELERSLRALAKRTDFRVVHYSLQHDHVHLLVEAGGVAALSNGMKSLAARLARAVNRVFGRRGAVLDGRYHHRPLATPREVRAALAYVLLNARKHAGQRDPALASLNPWIDPASSGRWFDGWTERPAPPVDRPAVVNAQTWLLRTGWRVHGRIRTDEVPGRAKRKRTSTLDGSRTLAARS
jgi:REP element-mobilizing transposase RayT